MRSDIDDEREGPMQQELAPSSGYKRSAADDEGYDVLTRRRIEERRAAKQASATSVQELEESRNTDTGTSSSAGALMMSAEALLVETRETEGPYSLSTPTGTCRDSSFRNDGLTVFFLSSSQGHDCDHQGARQDTVRFLGEYADL